MKMRAGKSLRILGLQTLLSLAWILIVILIVFPLGAWAQSATPAPTAGSTLEGPPGGISVDPAYRKLPDAGITLIGSAGDTPAPAPKLPGGGPPESYCQAIGPHLRCEPPPASGGSPCQPGFTPCETAPVHAAPCELDSQMPCESAPRELGGLEPGFGAQHSGNPAQADALDFANAALAAGFGAKGPLPPEAFFRQGSPNFPTNPTPVTAPRLAPVPLGPLPK